MNRLRPNPGVFAGNCLRVAAMILLGVCSGPAFAGDDDQPDYKEEFKNILRKTERHHYIQKKFSKEPAQKWIRRFIEDMDRDKNLFSRDEVDALVDIYGKKIKNVTPAAIPVMDKLFTDIAQRAQQTSMLIDSILTGPIDVGAQKYYQPSSGWPATEADRVLAWKLKLQSEIVEWQLSGDTRENAGKTLSALYKRSFAELGRMKATKKFELIVNSLFAVLDSHTAYTADKEINFKNLELMVGTGLQLQEKHGMVKVSSVLKNSPADRAGVIQPGDHIVAIAQQGGEYEAVNGYLLDEVIENLRGPLGAVVRLRLRQAYGFAEVALTREKIEREEESVDYSLHEIAAGRRNLKLISIHIPAFYFDYAAMIRKPDYRSATGDVKAILEKSDKLGIDGVLLDLRGNGGGSLDEGNNVAGLFVGSNPLVQIKYRSGSVQVLNGKSEAIVKRPVVVLVDEVSAGSSEIVAAAIQDYKKGLVIGQLTYGLGTVQTVEPTENGRLKITLAEYFRASGHSFQWFGVTPDITLPLLHTGKGGIMREKDLPVSLTPTQLPAVKSYPPSAGLDVRVFAEKYSGATRETRLEKYGSLVNTINERYGRGKALDYAAAKADTAEFAALEKSLAAYGDMEQQEALKILADLVLQQK